MTHNKANKRHDNVSFWFLGAGEDEDLRGSVVVRDEEMVLDIPDGDGPYLIAGKKSGHVFAGSNSIRSVSNNVAARWADIGGRFVGTWVEEGSEYLFAFRLSSSTD
jgi:hypothetical protein